MGSHPDFEAGMQLLKENLRNLLAEMPDGVNIAMETMAGQGARSATDLSISRDCWTRCPMSDWSSAPTLATYLPQGTTCARRRPTARCGTSLTA